MSTIVRPDHLDLVTLVTVPGVGHVEAWNDDPATYDRALRFSGRPRVM